MRVLWLFTFLTCFQFSSAIAQAQPPSTPIRDVNDVYFGTTVVDHYRYLEDLKSPEVVTWFKAQDDYTRATLASIPGREKLYNRIHELDTAAMTVNSISVDGGHYFYLKTLPEANNRRLYVRAGLKGPERLLIDPETLTANGVHYSIDYYVPSLDGKLVAVGISPGGSENSAMRVMESDTGRDLGERIDLAQFGGVAWLPDGKAFYYTRLRKLDPGEPVSNKYLKSAVYFHQVGQDPREDVKVAGFGMAKDVAISETDFPVVVIPAESRWALLVIGHGVQNEITAYYSAIADIHGASTSWKKLADVDDDVTSFDVRGDHVYLLSHKDASRYKVLHLQLPETKTETVMSPSEMVLRDVKVAKDAVYVPALDGGLGRLWRIPYGAKPEQVKLPVDGAIQDFFTDPRLPGALVRLASWTKSPLYYSYDPNAKHLSDTGLLPPSPVDFSEIESKEVKVKVRDGTEVPLSIVYKRGITLDGTHPAVLHGYGSYAITLEPSFDATNLAWLERGGVIATAHVRGGGEYGEDWHVAGQKSTKENTIHDFIDCAEYLVKQKYTSPAYLAGEGTSAGGITIGGAITERPELFAAALDNVGMSDDLRAELQVNGPVNVVEFGTVKNEAEFHNLLKISAYHRIQDKTPYPAVLLTTGVNDPRVDPWQMAKMTARLQAATSSGKPVLLRVNYDGGHGTIGSTKQQRDQLIADQVSFLLWQF
ncbi:MAG: S9 family peptidase, partial [Acidobacteria bacterium]|nr:S9 family peptidase [Acidobacteriota bacterium]